MRALVYIEYMTRYKGRPSTKSVERNFPHIVELPVPENGFGKQLDFIEIFYVNAGIEMRHGVGRREDERDYVRFCFADPARFRDYSVANS